MTLNASLLSVAVIREENVSSAVMILKQLFALHWSNSRERCRVSVKSCCRERSLTELMLDRYILSRHSPVILCRKLLQIHTSLRRHTDGAGLYLLQFGEVCDGAATAPSQLGFRDVSR